MIHAALARWAFSRREDPALIVAVFMDDLGNAPFWAVHDALVRMASDPERDFRPTPAQVLDLAGRIVRGWRFYLEERERHPPDELSRTQRSMTAAGIWREFRWAASLDELPTPQAPKTVAGDTVQGVLSERRRGNGPQALQDGLKGLVGPGRG